MKKLIIVLTFILNSILSLAQPINDNCSGAQNLGTLPTPSACPSGVGSLVNVVGTTINATSPSPYTYLLGCQTGGNQSAPALDVWYKFVASGTQANINITPGSAPVLQNPSITLWIGTNCSTLSGVNCDNNGTAAGNNTVTFQPLIPGTTYYIQISGMTSGGSGNFNFSINSTNDCNNCLQTSTLTVSPLPIGGAYLPNQSVTFCYTITSYTQVTVNWLHGIIPTFGNGWNMSTLTSSGIPPSSSGGYGWFWANGPLGMGWWVDYDPAGPTGPDGNFANNYGYNPISGTGSWTFCWTIKTKSTCTSGTNLNVSINTTSDGETGSWTSVACLGDPNYTFGAVLNCCTSTATFTNPTCYNGTNGTATAVPNGIGPYTYSWNTSPIQTTQTATNLPSGTYTVTVTDGTGCVSTATVTLINPSPIVVGNITHN